MVINDSDLAGIRERHTGQRIVLTSGTFDLFHVGHLRYLEAARSHGDIMVVFLSGDNRVKYRKGPERPIIPETERAEIIDALEIVDYVMLDHGYNEPGRIDPHYEQILDALQPDMYVTDGPDQRFFELNGRPTQMKIVERIPAGHYGSTSAIIRHINELPLAEYELHDD